MDCFIDPSFQEVNSPFVLLFESETDGEAHTVYCLPKVEIKDYNIMTDGQNLFDQPIKNGLKTYENIRKIPSGQGDVCTPGCLLDYNHFKERYW